MKDRLLPKSFWEPPSRPTNNIHRAVDPSESELFETRTGLIKITAPPDTNLLFSLFKILEQTVAAHHHNNNHHHRSKSIANHTINYSHSEPKEKEITKRMKTIHIFSKEVLLHKQSVEDDLLAEQLLDDPYLSIEQDQLHNKSIKSNGNYSDLLSDLVVNL